MIGFVWLRLALLAAFVVLMWADVLEWGVRYYALATVLGVLGLSAAVELLIVPRPFKPHGSRRGSVKPVAGRSRATEVALHFAKALTLAIVVVLAALPAIVFPQSAGPLSTTGNFVVGRALVSVSDLSRTESYGSGLGPRRLAIGLWYPEGEATRAGSHPLVVFSHGSLGVLTSNESLYGELASHGYVVAAIGHPYQALYVTHEDGSRTWLDPGFLRELRGENARVDPEGSLVLYRRWLSVRTADLDFAIDHITGSLATIDAVAMAPHSTATLERVRPLIDPTTLVVMGHSLGGAAALALGRFRRDVSAVVALEAPAMGDLSEAEDGGFVLVSKPYPVPVMNVYSDDTWWRLDELPQYAGNLALRQLDGAGAREVHLPGTNHLGLTDLALTSPLLTRLLGGSQEVSAETGLRRLNTAVVEFLDETLAYTE